MLMFSVEVPFDIQNDEMLQSEVTPVDVARPSTGEENVAPLKANTLENPSFEDWDVDRPEGYNDAYASEYRHVSFTYHGPGITGIYAGKVEVEATSYATASNYLYQDWTTLDNTVIEPGITLTFDWNTLANPDMGSNGYIYVEVNTLGSAAANLYYVLSHGTWGLSNGSIDTYILMNDTLNQWNSFDRNITEDFLEAYGSISSIQYINRIWFRSYSPIDASGIMEIAYDNIVLTNGTFSGWIKNGDFETGVSTPWYYADTPRGYIGQSLDSPDATHSLNLSVPVNTYGGLGDAYVYKSYPYPGGFFASEPEMFIVDFDWKYSDSAGLGSQQYAEIQLCFRNESDNYYLHFDMGTHNDQPIGFNSSTRFRYMVPEAGVRDTWEHSTLDLYEYMTAVGLQDVALYYLMIYVRNNRLGASVTLLVDNLQFITYPTGDPGFEEDWYDSAMTPFAGWPQWLGETGVISRSTDAFIGTYACNLTVENSDSAGVSRYLYHYLNPSDLTNFSWRLDEIGDIYSYAHIEIEFSNGNSLIYVLGAGSSYAPNNSSNLHRILPSGYNEVGTWNHLVVNLTAHVTEAFGYWSGVYINRIKLITFASPGQRVSILYDDMQFIDGAPPVVDLVSFLPSTPMYYDDVEVWIWAYDDRTGIDYVYVDYFDGTSWYGLPATETISNYTVTIPSYPYGTTIMFQIIAVDNGGVGITDNNGGAMYSYFVDDDVDPGIVITSPFNMSEIETYTVVGVSTGDLGSPIDRVEFRLDTTLFATDYTATYSVPFYPLDFSLGLHIINATSYDAAGNSASDHIVVNLIDITTPTIDSPTNVTFDEGESGYSIEWSPDDYRPSSYQILIDGAVQRSGLWNSSSETILVSLDGLSAGVYNYTCVIYDEAGLMNYDTVWVTVNEVLITTTITTTTTTTPITTTTTTTTIITTTTTTTTTIEASTTTNTGTPSTNTGTGPPTGGIDATLLTMLIIGGGAVVLVIVITLVAKKSRA